MIENSQLGLPTVYPDHYDPSLLFAIDRASKRAELSLLATDGSLPFRGFDFWNAYEVSWLTPSGKPQVAIMRVAVPYESPSLVESKSFKLYLNSFNQTTFNHEAEVQRTIHQDLQRVIWGEGKRTEPASSRLSVELILPTQFHAEHWTILQGGCIDDLDIQIPNYLEPAPNELYASGAVVQETLHSHLLKSNCPVTGQPDWATLQISYQGPKINAEGLLKYIVSFRQYGDFHEHCIERIFMDIMNRCQPHQLSVMGRYTRRGGLDINPWRTTGTEDSFPSLSRVARQ